MLRGGVQGMKGTRVGREVYGDVVGGVGSFDGRMGSADWSKGEASVLMSTFEEELSMESAIECGSDTGEISC